MSARSIKTRLKCSSRKNVLILGGQYDGKHTHLWIQDVTNGIVGFCTGTLAGQKLYRLAKTIVKEFENNS